MKTRMSTWVSICVVFCMLATLLPSATAQAKPSPPYPAGTSQPQGLPLPYLSDPDVADAPFGATPTVDGVIAPGEYAGAGKIVFPGYGGDVEVFLRQDATALYIAFDFPDPQTSSSAAQVFLDTAYDRASTPQPDDYRLSITQSGAIIESQGTGSGWSNSAPSGWTAAVATTPTGWQAEFSIDYAKLGLTASTFQVLGLSFINAWTPTWDHYWPTGAFWTNPSTWGHLVSSSDWGTFYWKPGPWEDYAPSGVPDFDQMQMGLSFAASFAAANSLWWFDSKFEQQPVGPVGATLPISDSYTLVQPYGLWDDHDPQNAPALAADLAIYFQTDVNQPGTHIYDMYDGIQRYLRDRGVWDEYIVTLINQPDYFWIAEEVMRSEDVILLLGFWQEIEIEPGAWMWQRIGGHYVTVAGVDVTQFLIAFSDPAQDAAEMTGIGRVLNGALLPHSPAPHPPVEHNDAGNVSHDVYMIMPGSPSPGGIFWIPDYFPPSFLLDLPGLNPNPRWEEPPVPWMGGPIHTEIEYALAVSPYTWKASGRWMEDETPLYGRSFMPFDDFAPSGMPDFDQQQANWGYVNLFGTWQWSFCGPAAAANSLWWFDSKFEHQSVVPPAIADSYWLVQPYGPWDDHHPLNADDPATPWPPPGWPMPGPMPPGQGEFIEELALYFLTDQPPTGYGTDVMNLYQGIEHYISDRGLRQGYVITQVHQPEFWWVAEEVERSEDVILLMGFWQDHGDPDGWVRLGGHYVNLAGVDKQGGYVGFSDPWFDRMETVLHPNEFIGFPLWTGRVGSDGDPPLGRTTLPYTHTIPHPPGPLHNDAANVSHDVYWVRATDSPGGVWGPAHYVQSWSQVENFWGMNTSVDVPLGDPTVDVQTEVEWAVAVSPVADVTVIKSVTPLNVTPGEWLTFTLHFINFGSLPAEDVVLDDALPSGLINPTTIGYSTSNGLPVTHRPGTTFTWDLPDLAWHEWGLITITAQVDPALAWPASTTLTNTAIITTSSVEQYQVPEMPNESAIAFTVETADLTVTKTATPTVVQAGDWLTYTLVYTNHSPAMAANTVITDLLHGWLVNSSFAIWTSYPSAMPTPTGRYIWPLGDVPAGGWGILTVTAQISPTLSGAGVLPNTVSIATDTAEHDLTNNMDSADVLVVRYGVDLQPPTLDGAGNPRDTVTYTLSLHNTGSLTDTFGITGVSSTGWVTTYPAQIGPLAAGANAPLTVTVQIPAGANDGDFDRLTLTATSQNDAHFSASSILTTTAYTGTITRGVVLSPHAAAMTGDPGATVTYTLRITNTGSVADTIGLSHTTPGGWTVAFSANPLSLGTGIGQDVEVYVGIPLGATPGAMQAITVTATSQADATAYDRAVLTTEVTLITYGLSLQPPTAQSAGNPGDMVTYTLSLTNLGDVADTFTIAGIVSGQTWTTAYPAQIGPLAARANAPVTVTVQIPPGANDGAWSQLTLTATSQGDVSQSATSVMTTTAYTGTIIRGVALSPHAAAATGDPGATVTYTLRVTNTGSVPDTIGLNHTTPSAWTVAFSANPLSLGSGVGQDVAVYVGIPLSATPGAMQAITVTATSQADSNAYDQAVLSTTVNLRRLYLPLVSRNYTP